MKLTLTAAFFASLFLLTVVASSSFQRDVHEKKEEGKAKLLTVLILTIPSSGHLAVPAALGEELVRRGHNVTFATAAIEGVPNRARKMAERAGMKYLNLGPASDTTRQMFHNTSLLMDLQTSGSQSTMHRMMTKMITDSVLKMTDMLELYPPEQWDIIAADYFVAPLFSCLCHRSKTPLVLLSSSFHIQGLPPWPFPNILSGDTTDDMSFLDRLKGFWTDLALWYISNFVVMQEIKDALGDLCKDVSSSDMVNAPGERYPLIVSTAMGFEFPRTVTPLEEYVGPVLARFPDPIPDDMLSWLDSKEEGTVVYISMGSIVPLLYGPGRAVAEAVVNVSYSVLWSLSESNRDFLSGLELDLERIYLSSWIPQLSVLRHKSIGMAVIHGGMNGVNEALGSGVPVLVLPSHLMEDQLCVAVRVKHSGAGLYIHRNRATAADVASKVEEIISSKRFKVGARKLSKLYCHAGGTSRAADLVEFYADVGYNHLITAYTRYNWSWVQYYNLDVRATLLGVACLALFVLVKTCRRGLRWCLGGGQDKPKQA